MTRLVPAFEQFFDAAGDPLVEGKLFFYETGDSTTLKATYADPGETIPNSNPVILSADGRCPNVFGTGSYLVKLTDKNEVQILQRDPVGGSGTQEFGADWVSDITYGIGDIVREGNVYYRSETAQNRGNLPSATVGVNWTTWPPNTQDAEIFRDEAEAAALAAATSASNAATSESNAATSASNAATSESNAATSASNAATSESNAAASALSAANSAASAGKDFSGTSTTNVTIGTGAKTFTIETGKGFVVAQMVVVAFDATNKMLGNVTAYDDGTGQLDVNVVSVIGSGTYAAWGVSIEGIPDPTGQSGKYLTNDGFNFIWADVPTGVIQTSTAKFSTPVVLPFGGSKSVVFETQLTGVDPANEVHIYSYVKCSTAVAAERDINAGIYNSETSTIVTDGQASDNITVNANANGNLCLIGVDSSPQSGTNTYQVRAESDGTGTNANGGVIIAMEVAV